MTFIFLLGLALFGWGLRFGPFCNTKAYEEFPPKNPILFYGTMLACGLGATTAFISALFLSGILPHGK